MRWSGACVCDGMSASGRRLLAGRIGSALNRRVRMLRPARRIGVLRRHRIPFGVPCQEAPPRRRHLPFRWTALLLRPSLATESVGKAMLKMNRGPYGCSKTLPPGRTVGTFVHEFTLPTTRSAAVPQTHEAESMTRNLAILLSVSTDLFWAALRSGAPSETSENA